MSDEGFGGDAAGVAEVNNWFVDLYHELSAIKMPHSGQSPSYLKVVTGVIRSEDWPDSLVGASTRMHFDDNPGARYEALRPDLNDTAGITAEWDRLRRVSWRLAQEARERDDPLELLEVLGIGLHPLQDFYSHTNWIEAQKGHGILGSDGPGWSERGFGSYPTWFDVPPEERNKVEIYGDSTPGHRRIHGLWDANGNNNLTDAMNKDWAGRPQHLQAVISAYFASRQWIEAVRNWVHDDAFWAKAQRYRAVQAELSHDLEGMFRIMLYTGHWEGQGEPLGGGSHGVGGSLPDLVRAVRDYFQPGTNPLAGGNPLGSLEKTQYRKRFEKTIERMADRRPIGELQPVPSSQGLQSSMKIVVMRVLKIHGEGLGDPGPDEADMFGRAKIDGQSMASAVIHGHDSFAFPKPFAPFTWFKPIPATPDEEEPVESIEVEVHTADASWAGTNDDVFLRLAGGLRFPLDKGLYDDFERNDRDTYSVGIDTPVWKGLRVGDLNTVKIEKSPDGIAGGWKLAGIKLRVNGRQFYDNQHINRWLEDDHRVWEAPDFERRDPRGSKIPVVLYLGEDDTLYGEPDEGDINPDDNRDYASVGYEPGQPLQLMTKGGNRLGGRMGYGDDPASALFRLETLTPTLMGDFSPPPAEPGPLPDLTITEFNINHITVVNQGEGDAGPFRLTAANTHFQFEGLPAGSSETRTFPGLNCNGNYFALVDDLEQVAETDETNNNKQSEEAIC